MFLQNSLHMQNAKRGDLREIIFSHFAIQRNTKLQLHAERFIRYRNGAAGRNVC